jgi:hypothetical protein
MTHDDAAPRTLYTVELTLTADAAVAGRVTLRITSRGRDPATVVIPDRPDQIEWFDPDARRLADAVPRVRWTAWRSDSAGLVDESRPSTAQTASKHVTLGPGDARDAVVDLSAALDALFGPGAFARGWCARAWLVGSGHPLPSNIVCWPVRA